MLAVNVFESWWSLKVPDMDVISIPFQTPIVRAVNLHKTYFRAGEIQVLRGVNIEVNEGEFLAIVGSSGCGKSTLLHLLGMLDQPTHGEVYFAGKRVDLQSASERDRLRNQSIGFCLQLYHLLPELSALENVMLPALIGASPLQYWRRRKEWTKQAQMLLERVGLAQRMHHKPKEMSGGEMQRAAIARSLFANPRVLLADEPTGNLDPETGDSILDLLMNLQQENRLTIVMVTHNHESHNKPIVSFALTAAWSSAILPAHVLLPAESSSH